MKYTYLVCLLTIVHISNSGNIQSDTIPDKMAAAVLLEQKQAEATALQQKITQLEAAIALLTAQKNEESLRARRTTSVVYYRRRGSNDEWKPVSPAYPLDHNDGNVYARVMVAKDETKRSCNTKIARINTHIKEIQTQLTALKKRLLELEVFLYTEFPDTFTAVK